jgi:hypothetical protein
VPLRASPWDKAPTQACAAATFRVEMASGIRTRKVAAYCLVAAAVLGPFYAVTFDAAVPQLISDFARGQGFCRSLDSPPRSPDTQINAARDPLECSPVRDGGFAC